MRALRHSPLRLYGKMKVIRAVAVSVKLEVFSYPKVIPAPSIFGLAFF
jgi:hypothetical protein